MRGTHLERRVQFVLVNGVAVLKEGRLVDEVFPGWAVRASITQ